jgi:hypothetical protein
MLEGEPMKLPLFVRRRLGPSGASLKSPPRKILSRSLGKARRWLLVLGAFVTIAVFTFPRFHPDTQSLNEPDVQILNKVKSESTKSNLSHAKPNSERLAETKNKIPNSDSSEDNSGRDLETDEFGIIRHVKYLHKQPINSSNDDKKSSDTEADESLDAEESNIYSTNKGSGNKGESGSTNTGT